LTWGQWQVKLIIEFWYKIQRWRRSNLSTTNLDAQTWDRVDIHRNSFFTFHLFFSLSQNHSHELHESDLHNASWHNFNNFKMPFLHFLPSLSPRMIFANEKDKSNKYIYIYIYIYIYYNKIFYVYINITHFIYNL